MGWSAGLVASRVLRLPGVARSAQPRGRDESNEVILRRAGGGNREGVFTHRSGLRTKGLCIAGGREVFDRILESVITSEFTPNFRWVVTCDLISRSSRSAPPAELAREA
jgi:hypothetical protein